MVASEKGVVVGRLTFTEDGDAIDCSKMGVGGKAIPPNIDKVHLRAHHAGHHACSYMPSDVSGALTLMCKRFREVGLIGWPKNCEFRVKINGIGSVMYVCHRFCKELLAVEHHPSDRH